MSNHILIGKTITEVLIASDKKAIMFRTNDGDVIAKCDADCCSFTWIEHVELPALGFPAKVVSVGDLDMPDLGNMEDCDVVSYYGFKVTTDRGEVVIDYRNDSNGYYCGWLSWPGQRHYGGVYGQNAPSDVEWVQP